MKKFISILLATLLLFSCGVVFASGDVTFGGVITPDTSVAAGGLGGIASKIIGAIRLVGYFIAVGMLVFIGVKYIMASANEKAELKGLLVKYVIGAALIVFGTQIAAWLFSIA